MIKSNGLTTADFRTPESHLELQRLILAAQSREEAALGPGADYLSDRCVLDCLGYGRWRAEQMGPEGVLKWRRIKEELKVRRKARL